MIGIQTEELCFHCKKERHDKASADNQACSCVCHEEDFRTKYIDSLREIAESEQNLRRYLLRINNGYEEDFLTKYIDSLCEIAESEQNLRRYLLRINNA